MTEAKVTMSVRSVSDSASIIDVQGEITSFAENVLTDAYTEATSGGAKVIILNFEGPRVYEQWVASVCWSRC